MLFRSGATEPQKGILKRIGGPQSDDWNHLIATIQRKILVLPRSTENGRKDAIERQSSTVSSTMCGRSIRSLVAAMLRGFSLSGPPKMHPFLSQKSSAGVSRSPHKRSSTLGAFHFHIPIRRIRTIRTITLLGGILRIVRILRKGFCLHGPSRVQIGGDKAWLIDFL